MEFSWAFAASVSFSPRLTPNPKERWFKNYILISVKALNEIKASLGWRVVYAWIGEDPCGDGDLPRWSGVTCSNQGDYRVVTELEVYAVSIVGPFPVAVTNLLDLTRLYLNNNFFTGGIPAQLANLTNLEIIYLSYNKMSGTIPSDLAFIPRLTYLYLDHNLFPGRIPDALYKHPFLKEMYIESNQFKPGVNPKGVHKVLEIADSEFLF